MSYSDSLERTGRYHLNRADIPKLKTEDDVEVLQNAEITDKATSGNTICRK